MKKFFSLVAALLLVGCLFAQAPISDTDPEILFGYRCYIKENPLDGASYSGPHIFFEILENYDFSGMAIYQTSFSGWNNDYPERIKNGEKGLIIRDLYSEQLPDSDKKVYRNKKEVKCVEGREFIILYKDFDFLAWLREHYDINLEGREMILHKKN